MRLRATILLATLLGIAVQAHAMRCGTALISPGDRKLEILHRCGEPDAVEQWHGYRSFHFHHPHPGVGHEAVIPVTVEEWTYNLGPHRFMRLLHFENGVLRWIKSLDYGH